MGIDKATSRDIPVELVALLVDNSGSMRQTDFSPTRLDAAKAAALVFLRRKRLTFRKDRTAVVAFATRPQLWSHFGSHPFEAQQALAALQAEGDTDISAALELGCKQLQGEAKSCKNPLLRAVLLSDGEPTAGPHPTTGSLLETIAKQGIVVDTVLLGEHGEPTLRAISQRTGGHFCRSHEVKGLLDQYERLAIERAGAR